MSGIQAANIFENVVLSYFAVFALLSMTVTYLGIRAVVAHARRRSNTALKDLLAHDYYEPISILVAARNEEDKVVSSVRSMLNLQHPMFDVIVCNDGSSDRTLDELVEHLSLVEVPVAHDELISTRPLRRMFRSLAHANLTVIDKEHGGRADALNACLNIARRPLVCVAPADSVLDPRSLVRASRSFVEDEAVVAVMGTVRPLAGAVVHNGQVAELQAPRGMISRLQVLEYARSFFTAQAGWNALGAPTTAGGFGVFRRRVLNEVGGWWTGTVADDAEILIRLHRHLAQTEAPYRIELMPDAVCWVQTPDTLPALLRQRHRWTRGTTEVLRHHAKLLLNPAHGRVGMLAVPYRWIFGLGSVVCETAAYVYIAVTALQGNLNPAFAAAFGALTIGFGVIESQLAVAAETLVLDRYSRLRDRFALLAASIVEQVGLRQILLPVRLHAAVRARSYHGAWQKVARTGREVSEVADPPSRAMAS